MLWRIVRVYLEENPGLQFFINRNFLNNFIFYSLQSWHQRHRVKLVRRLVRKSGKSSIHQKSSKERSFRFLLDLSNTLIESPWVWTLLVVSFVFILTWVMFAGFWAIISIENVEAWNGTSDTCLEGELSLRKKNICFNKNCFRYKQFCWIFAFQHRNSNHDWLRRSLYQRILPRSHYRALHSVSNWSGCRG